MCIKRRLVGGGTKCTDQMILSCMGIYLREFKTLLFHFLHYGGRGWREGGNEIA